MSFRCVPEFYTGAFWASVEVHLKSHGYHVSPVMFLNAKEVLEPQSRRRGFAIAWLGDGSVEPMDGPECHSEKNIPAQILNQKCDISLESATLGRQRCWGALVAGLTECADMDRVYM